MKLPKVLICRGKDCRKKKEANRRLRQDVSEVASVTDVKCQKICDGPVLGVKVDGDWEWFKKIKKRYDRKAVLVAIQEGRLTKGARRKRVKSRSGKRR